MYMLLLEMDWNIKPQFKNQKRKFRHVRAVCQVHLFNWMRRIK